MKIVILDKKGLQIEVKNNILYIGLQKIPLHLVDVLMLFRSDTLLSAKVLTALAKTNIFVMVVSRQYSVALSHSHQAHNAELKLAQYQSALNPLPMARYFLKEKILSHIRQLEEHDVMLESDALIEQIEDAKDVAQLLGIEGAFSRTYFQYYFKLFPKGIHRNKRTRQPPKDPINAMLSYYYMLLYHLIAIRLYTFGFEPSIGFLHKPFRSHFALASDMMELFRAEVNEEVFRLFHENVVEKKDFAKKGEGVYLRYEKRVEIYKQFKLFYHQLETRLDKEIANIRSQLCQSDV